VPRVKILHYSPPSIKQTYDSRFLRGFTVATPIGSYVILSFPVTSSSSPTSPNHLKITYPIEVHSSQSGLRLASSTTSNPHSRPPNASTTAANSPASSSPLITEGIHTLTIDSSYNKISIHDDSRKLIVGSVDYFLLPDTS
jgi:hypothetical protein